MGKRINYLKYIIEHKVNVFIEGRKLGLGIWQLLKYDFSKITPAEFIQYADNFFGGFKTEKIRAAFILAWLNHKHMNKHHWQYWLDIKDKKVVPLRMPIKYVKEMIADWNAMSRKFKPEVNRIQATEEWFRNETDIILHIDTHMMVQFYFQTGEINEDIYDQ